ncbi:MAG TPA: alpha/beta hydrolase [Stenotrophobium sp.]|nr:alpha/beta hydrolase [Stenotrophobium sp.]
MMQILLRGVVRGCLKPVFALPVSLGFRRAWIKGFTSLVIKPQGTQIEALDMGGVPAERVSNSNATGEAVVLYLHGGAYVLGSPKTHRSISTHLAKAAHASVYVLDYRLAPEHPHPAALEDTLTAYRWLLDQGIAAARITLAGDSAGGGLALATALAIRDSGLPAPAALALLSPWTDLTHSGASYIANAALDPMLHHTWASASIVDYCGTFAPSHPGCSPLFADLKNLPRILIQVGSDEILLSDSERLEQKARAAGVDVRLHRYDGLWHVFQLHAGMMKASNEAVAEIAGFIRHG